MSEWESRESWSSLDRTCGPTWSNAANCASRELEMLGSWCCRSSHQFEKSKIMPTQTECSLNGAVAWLWGASLRQCKKCWNHRKPVLPSHQLVILHMVQSCYNVLFGGSTWNRLKHIETYWNIEPGGSLVHPFPSAVPQAAATTAASSHSGNLGEGWDNLGFGGWGCLNLQNA